MNDNYNLYLENDLTVNSGTSLDHLPVEDSIQSLQVRIESARSGRINRNLSFYTPLSMKAGVNSFIHPFKKHLQSRHNGEAVGVIEQAEYIEEFFPNASKEFLETIKTIDFASSTSNGKMLVQAVKKLIKSPEYNSPEYRGLGIASIYGNIYEPGFIHDLKENKSVKGTVSIGGKSKEVYCSVCSERIKFDKKSPHRHEKGSYYDGELCFYVHNDLYLDHCGFVTVPADPYTSTEIIKDEELDNLSLEVLDYNSTEKLMNLEELRKKFSEDGSVQEYIKETFDEPQASKAVEIYESTLKGSRQNHFLLTDSKTLNLRNPVGLYLAQTLVEKFDKEDENRKYLEEILENAKSVLKIENIDDALQEVLKDKEKTIEEPQKTETDKKEHEEVKDSYSDEMLAKISDLLDQKLKAFFNKKEEELKVEDKVQENKSLLDQLSSLRAELTADEAALDELKDSYKNSLIDQISLLKNDAISSDYLDKLKGRTISELQITLEDLKEERHNSKIASSTVEGLEKTEGTEAVVQDNYKETSETTAKAEDDAEQTEETTGDTTTVEDSAQVNLSREDWYAKRSQEVGSAQAYKEYKIKFIK